MRQIVTLAAAAALLAGPALAQGMMGQGGPAGQRTDLPAAGGVLAQGQMGQPGMAQPGMGGSMTQPGTGASGMNQPGMGGAMTQPGTGASGMNQPGMGAASDMTRPETMRQGRQERMSGQRMGGQQPRTRAADRSMRGAGGDVNAAFLGGGVVLEGAPGAAAPSPTMVDPARVQGGVFQVR